MPEPSTKAPSVGPPTPPAPVSPSPVLQPGPLAPASPPSPLAPAAPSAQAGPGAASSGSVARSPRSVEPGAWRLSGVAKLRLVIAFCFLGSIGLFASYLGGLRGQSDVKKERILSVARNTQLESGDMGRLIEDDFSAYWKDELLCQYFLMVSVVLAYAGSALLLVDRVWNKIRERKSDDETA